MMVLVQSCINKWSIIDAFRDYLYHAQSFTVFTDNNPVTHLLTQPRLNATAQRWAAELADFSFDIKYRLGKKNLDADPLSRLPILLEYTQSINQNEVKACLGKKCDPWIFSLSCKVEALLEETEWGVELLSQQEIRKAQRDDVNIGQVLQVIERGSRPTKEERSGACEKLKGLFNCLKSLKEENGLLYRIAGRFKQLVLPEKYKDPVLRKLHHEMGHINSEKVLYHLRKRFYWPCMQQEVESYIKERCSCLMNKKPNIRFVEELGSVESSSPFELVSLDFLHLEKSTGGYEYILVLVDHFTRFSVCYATKNKEAKTAAKCLFDEFVLRYGFPHRILHDQGTEFNNDLFNQLEKLCGIGKCRTTPYHPMGNGKCERMNRTLLGMLRTLPEKAKSKWKDHLQKMVHAYNATVHRSTGFSPFFLMYGRDPILPVDLMFGNSLLKQGKTHKKYVAEWKETMEEAYKIAREKSADSIKENKDTFNKKARHSVLEVGDRVLVKNVKERGGPGKLRSHWERYIYVVKERKGNGPVYVVEPEKEGKSRCLHRNLLLPVGEQFEIEVDDDTKTSEKGKKEKDMEKVEMSDTDKSDSESKESSESSEETKSDDTNRRSQKQEKEVVNKRISKRIKRFTYDKLGTPTMCDISVYRICQEALTDIKKIINRMSEMIESRNQDGQSK